MTKRMFDAIKPLIDSRIKDMEADDAEAIRYRLLAVINSDTDDYRIAGAALEMLLIQLIVDHTPASYDAAFCKAFADHLTMIRSVGDSQQ